MLPRGNPNCKDWIAEWKKWKKKEGISLFPLSFTLSLSSPLPSPLLLSSPFLLLSSMLLSNFFLVKYESIARAEYFLTDYYSPVICSVFHLPPLLSDLWNQVWRPPLPPPLGSFLFYFFTFIYYFFFEIWPQSLSPALIKTLISLIFPVSEVLYLVADFT